MHRILLLFLVVVSHFRSQCVADEASSKPRESIKKSPSIDEMLLFFPSKFPEGDWQPKHLNFEDVYFDATDGTHLHGWFCPCESPRAVVLIAHGNGGNVTSRADWLTYLQSRMRVSTFVFDYRGYGRSEGAPTVEGVLQDARAARAKLCELTEVKPSEIVLFGESLGGAVAVQLSSELAPSGLVLQSTFSSLRAIADVHYPKLSWLVPEEKLNSITAIKSYHGPLLMSHGTADRTIPYSLGKDLFQAANKPKTLVTIKNRDHDDWMKNDYLRKLDAFISMVGKGKTKQ
ncbi:MAG: alpha/beta hydrolase [Planctomycetaceae bacterium]